jgi:hypothetical protein
MNGLNTQNVSRCGCLVCSNIVDMDETTLKDRAERYFRGIYGSDPSVVEELAAPEVFISYPVFTRLFNTPVLRGREAARNFAIRFGRRWSEPEIAFHEALQEENSVVLVWSFQALRTPIDLEDQTNAGRLHSWGGITLLRFDETGRITAEIGEESAPGPFIRIQGG